MSCGLRAAVIALVNHDPVGVLRRPRATLGYSPGAALQDARRRDQGNH
jgi:hypothetical protein